MSLPVSTVFSFPVDCFPEPAIQKSWDPPSRYCDTREGYFIASGEELHLKWDLIAK